MIHHDMHFGRTFMVAKPDAIIHLDRVANFKRVEPTAPADEVVRTSDDWPFLYIKPNTVPWGYCILLTLILLSAWAAAGRAFGKTALSSEFDVPMFLMGAAFMLIETRGVTQLSLLFGSTWVVNSAVFGGILTMVLVANLLVDRFKPTEPLFWFIPLLASVILLAVITPAYFNGLALPVRGTLGGMINALPIGIAGIIVSIYLNKSRNPQAALGSNLLGSVIGGCTEYLSMWLGLRALALVALGLYVIAFLHILRSRKTTSMPIAADLNYSSGNVASTSQTRNADSKSTPV
jgi:hypothetical protein